MGLLLVAMATIEVVSSTCMYVQTYNGCVYYYMAMVVVGYMCKVSLSYVLEGLLSITMVTIED